MVTVLVLTGLLSYVPSAQAQSCSFQPDRNDASTQGIPRINATTTPNISGTNCNDWSTQTEGCVAEANNVTCDLGTQSGTACYHWRGGQPPEQSRILAGAPTRYGSWRGWSKHWIVQTSTSLWTLVDENWTTLNAGSESGGGSCDPDTGPCECDPSVEVCQPPASPILIPLTRAQKYKLTSATNGVYFDLNADGIPERTAWTAADARLAFLAIDRNGNGQIDDGTELFGNYTLPGVTNGFGALQEMNRLLKGGAAVNVPSISSDEPLYTRLLLWEDVNHDGISQPYELQPAAPLVSDIGLGYEVFKRRDGYGNTFRYRGWASVRTAPGRNLARGQAQQKERHIDIYDVFFTR